MNKEKELTIPKESAVVLRYLEDYDKTIFSELFPKPDIFNFALGSFLGAAIGDSIGSFLEFSSKPTEKQAKYAMKMPGGGPHRISPGMVTDDTELAIGLAHGLIDMKGEFNLDSVAYEYGKWVRSSPFDMGMTCSIAMEEAYNSTGPNSMITGRMKNSALRSMGSKANGSLMRTTPIAIYGYKLSVEEIASISQEESSLSHVNASCQDSVAAYNIAVSYLIANPTEEDRNLKAFNLAMKWVLENACEEVKEWIALAKNKEKVPYTPLIGFVKIAFVHSFRHLLLKTNYYDAIYETVLGGGDTDTNAAIVGGMLGAYWGIDNIPQELIKISLNCVLREKLKRPEKYNPNQIPKLVVDLLNCAPEKIKK
ncbi:leucine rich repeat family protein [Anaeramoeba flamelloides]|uniref:Leucine rich repeat family protein n=1 Tax=Anaeramoeba flamelloides TaxID=1746091 RepID=A0ABQ8X563_9EUKA|nr:leucine rich repeat family protein [Anaeramoeba flamelloides]